MPGLLDQGCVAGKYGAMTTTELTGGTGLATPEGYEAPAVAVLGRMEELTQAFRSGGTADDFCAYIS